MVLNSDLVREQIYLALFSPSETHRVSTARLDELERKRTHILKSKDENYIYILL